MPTLLLAGVIRGIALPGDIAPQPQRCSVAPWCLPEADSGGAPQSRVRAAAAHAPGRATGTVPSLIGQCCSTAGLAGAGGSGHHLFGNHWCRHRDTGGAGGGVLVPALPWVLRTHPSASRARQ